MPDEIHDMECLLSELDDPWEFDIAGPVTGPHHHVPCIRAANGVVACAVSTHDGEFIARAPTFIRWAIKEIAWLRACMHYAGLKAFMRNKLPGEVAEHLHGIIKSHADAADAAEAKLPTQLEATRDVVAALRITLERKQHELTDWRNVANARSEELVRLVPLAQASKTLFTAAERYIKAVIAYNRDSSDDIEYCDSQDALEKVLGEIAPLLQTLERKTTPINT